MLRQACKEDGLLGQSILKSTDIRGMNNQSFDSKRIAEGYKERPFLHKQVIEQFLKDSSEQQYQNGLDVGCGAGNLWGRGLYLFPMQSRRSTPPCCAV